MYNMYNYLLTLKNKTDDTIMEVNYQSNIAPSFLLSDTIANLYPNHTWIDTKIIWQ